MSENLDAQIDISGDIDEQETPLVDQDTSGEDVAKEEVKRKPTYQSQRVTQAEAQKKVEGSRRSIPKTPDPLAKPIKAKK